MSSTITETATENQGTIGEIGLEPISLNELSGASPEPTPAPAPTPTPTTQPEPKQDAPTPKALDGLFESREEHTPKSTEDDQTTDTPDEKGALARLREEISRKHKEKQEAEQRYQSELEQTRKQYEELQARFEDYRRDTAITDPTQAPEVVEAAMSYEQSVAKVSKTLPPNVARSFLKNAKSLVDQFGNLGDLHDPEYDKRYEELQTRMKREFGIHSDEVMKNMPSLEEMASRVKDAVRTATEVSGDVQRTRSLKTHQQSAQTFDTSLKETLEFSPELANADPFAARNIVSTMIAQSPEFKEKSDKLLGFLRQGLVLPPPLSPEATKGLTQDQVAEAEANLRSNFAGASSEIYKNTALAYHSLLALPAVTRMYKDLKDKYDALIASSPSESQSSGRDLTPQTKTQEPEGPEGLRKITMEEIMRDR